MSDRSCKYCAAEIRWCRDDRGQWVPLDVVKIAATEPGAEYVVVGAEDARRIAKANRAKFGWLYRRHTCEQGRNDRALAKRQAADSQEAQTARRQLQFEHSTLPDNVTPMRSRRSRR